MLLKNEQVRFRAGACDKESEEGVLWRRLESEKQRRRSDKRERK